MNMEKFSNHRNKIFGYKGLKVWLWIWKIFDLS